MRYLNAPNDVHSAATNRSPNERSKSTDWDTRFFWQTPLYNDIVAKGGVEHHQTVEQLSYFPAGWQRLLVDWCPQLDCGVLGSRRPAIGRSVRTYWYPIRSPSSLCFLLLAAESEHRHRARSTEHRALEQYCEQAYTVAASLLGDCTVIDIRCLETEKIVSGRSSSLFPIRRQSDVVESKFKLYPLEMSAAENQESAVRCLLTRRNCKFSQSNSNVVISCGPLLWSQSFFVHFLCARYYPLRFMHIKLSNL